MIVDLNGVPMIIEWLKFQVAPAHREAFIQADEAIWTAALSTYQGFLGKAVWLVPDESTAVILVIQWATREQWKAIPLADLEEIEQRFDQTLDFDYEMVESEEFQVRRFATTLAVPGSSD